MANEKAPAPVKKGAPIQKSRPKGEVKVLDVFNSNNEKVRDHSLSAEVFGTRPNKHLLYEAVKQYRAGGRAGTHATKNRALVSGSGKKPWKQKGTGRARVGETRNPLWRHGGTVFGPQPRDYSLAMPKKARAAALRSALAQRVQDGALKIVDRFAVEIPDKPPYRLTRQFAQMLEKLGAGSKTVIVDHEPDQAVVLSARNIPGVKLVDASALNVYDVLDCKTLLVSTAALDKLEERLQP
jgi:large subunit ribosomal protein L4